MTNSSNGMLAFECLLKDCTPRLLVISWCYIVYIMLTQDLFTQRVHEHQIRRINQRVVQSQVVANLQLQKKKHGAGKCTHIHVDFFPSSWRVCQVCSSLVLVDYKMIDPIPTTLDSYARSQILQLNPSRFCLATVHHPMIFPIQISSSHIFPVKLANRPFLPQSTRKPPSPGPGNRLQRQPGDPAGARLRHRGSQALGRSQVLGWDKAAWLVGNPK